MRLHILRTNLRTPLHVSLLSMQHLSLMGRWAVPNPGLWWMWHTHEWKNRKPGQPWRLEAVAYDTTVSYIQLLHWENWKTNTRRSFLGRKSVSRACISSQNVPFLSLMDSISYIKTQMQDLSTWGLSWEEVSSVFSLTSCEVVDDSIQLSMTELTT